MENFQKASHRKLGAVFSSLDSSFSDEDKLRRVMDELDSDHDNFISLTEFAAFCHFSSEDGRASELRDAIMLYDPSILMGIEAACEK
nr:putative calcium-binding protein cml27 [Quercus suber]